MIYMKHFKNLVILTIVVLISQSAMAQRGGRRVSTSSTTVTRLAPKPPKVDGVTKREAARVKGEASANASANARAKQQANENSVLNNGTTVQASANTKAARLEAKRIKKEQKKLKKEKRNG